MNEVSIIINGMRYDAVELPHTDGCGECDIYNLMGNINADNYIGCICPHFNLGYNVCFKKSDKKKTALNLVLVKVRNHNNYG